MPERITAVAIKVGAMVVHMPEPYRHHDIIGKLPFGYTLGGQQGFLTNTGRFVDRREAKRIAEAAKQIIANERDAKGVPFKRTHPELFSEDLW